MAVAHVEVVPGEEGCGEHSQARTTDPSADRVEKRDRRHAGRRGEETPVEDQRRQCRREHGRVGRRLAPEPPDAEGELLPSPHEVEVEVRIDEPARVQIARGEAGRVRERLALVGAGGREGEALVETPEAKGRRRDENEDEQVRPSQAGRGRSPIGRAGTPATIE